jgi:uncharacterized protein (DUF1810 family)
MDDDPYRLERFIAAQDAGGIYERAVDELRAGAKRGHWMWFVFPQVAGLGFSAMSQRYALASLAEARAYLAHPVLGPRLIDCGRILAATERRSAAAIFGDIDAMKLRSSMTLFMSAAPDEPVFREVLEKFFGGQPDEATLDRLALPANAPPGTSPSPGQRPGQPTPRSPHARPANAPPRPAPRPPRLTPRSAHARAANAPPRQRPAAPTPRPANAAPRPRPAPPTPRTSPSLPIRAGARGVAGPGRRQPRSLPAMKGYAISKFPDLRV